MLPEWLRPMPVETFLQVYLQKQPLARPGAAAGAVPLFTQGHFDAVLASKAPLDLLTVREGRLVEAPAPGNENDVRRLLEKGVSVVVRGSERNDPGIADLARGFAEVLPGEVHVQLYATPAGTHSYGWHYDFEDVFIVQTAGIKDYYFRDNTVARATVLGETLDFGAVRAETTPLYSARLLPGDWLYLPARWWHFVTCAETSLSISVGVMPPEALHNARRLPAGWSGLPEA